MALPLSDAQRRRIVGLFCATLGPLEADTVVGVEPDGSAEYRAFVRHERPDGRAGVERSEHGATPGEAIAALYRKLLRQARSRHAHLGRELAAVEAEGEVFE